jgi:outer membrane protein
LIQWAASLIVETERFRPGWECVGLLEIGRVNTRQILLVGLTLAFFAQSAVAQDTKIGVLNALQALFNSDAAQVVQTELEQEFALDEARATELTEQLQSLQSEYQQNEAVMTEDEIRRMNANAQDLQVQLQLIQERVQQALQEKNQQFLASMQNELAAAVTDVVAEGGFDLILNADTAPYFAPVLDITARVTAKLNERAATASSN